MVNSNRSSGSGSSIRVCQYPLTLLRLRQLVRLLQALRSAAAHQCAVPPAGSGGDQLSGDRLHSHEIFWGRLWGCIHSNFLVFLPQCRSARPSLMDRSAKLLRSYLAGAVNRGAHLQRRLMPLVPYQQQQQTHRCARLHAISVLVPLKKGQASKN